MDVINALGRRKTSVARVYLSKGKGNVTINDRDYKSYIDTAFLHHKLLHPFNVTETAGQYDVKIVVHGGGVNGQVDAMSLGISRALVKINEELKPALKSEGLMTRDPRMVERKKPGQKKARKRFQFSKR
ncbi:MAG: 30S ribosomal protein S9 [Salibacteraceae bacterium]